MDTARIEPASPYAARLMLIVVPEGTRRLLLDHVPVTWRVVDWKSIYASLPLLAMFQISRGLEVTSTPIFCT